jgi:iron(III) transport system substrate-binding protein
MHKTAVLKLTVFLLVTLSACAAPTGAPAPENPDANIWSAEWSALAAPAQQEGKVVVKGNPFPELRADLPTYFKNRFGVDVEYLGTTSQEFAIQAEKERAVGIYTVDVVLGGAAVMYPTIYGSGWLDPLPPVISHPDAVDASKWPAGRLWFMDPEQQYVLRVSNYVNQSVFINTDYVKPGELRSWYDLLKPEYRGKIAINDPLAQGGGHLLSTILYMKLGEGYVRQLLIDQRPLSVRDTRQQADMLGRGSYPISLGIGQDDYQSLLDDGLPVSVVTDLREVAGYTTAGANLMGLMNNAPHPNAARLFINWILSKEGMEYFAKKTTTLPVRTDIDVSGFPPYLVPQPGLEYLDAYDYDFAVNQRLPLGETIRGMLR